MLGPGKYDDVCTELRDKTKAEAAIIIVIEGEKGSGFSCQAPLPVLAGLPAMLRSMARQIEADQQAGQL
jgi:hypothetical protein